MYGLENCVSEAKTQYQESLKNLERISNEIHEQRKRGKLRRELGERTEGVGEEQPVTYTEFVSTSSSSTAPRLTGSIILQEQLPPSPERTTPSISPQESPVRRLNRPEQLLRSCLLHTEALPAGIFAKTSSDRSSPDGDERTPTNTTDPFVLPSKQLPVAPPSVVIISSHSSAKGLGRPGHQRKTSDGYSSQATDDEDERTGSLHVLTDEQLEHLASVYHPLPAPPPPAGTTRASTMQLSESLLNSLSNPLSKLLQR